MRRKCLRRVLAALPVGFNLAAARALGYVVLRAERLAQHARNGEAALARARAARAALRAIRRGEEGRK